MDPTAYPGLAVEGKHEMTRVCHFNGDSIDCERLQKEHRDVSQGQTQRLAPAEKGGPSD